MLRHRLAAAIAHIYLSRERVFTHHAPARWRRMPQAVAVSGVKLLLLTLFKVTAPLASNPSWMPFNMIFAHA